MNACQSAMLAELNMSEKMEVSLKVCRCIVLVPGDAEQQELSRQDAGAGSRVGACSR